MDHDVLADQLARLKPTCIRDPLDSLLDEAAEKQSTLREAVAFPVGREVARKDERRLEMALEIARFPGGPRTRGLRLQGTAERRQAPDPGTGDVAPGGAWRPRSCCSVRQASASRTWPSPSAAKPSARVARCCSRPRRR